MRSLTRRPSASAGSEISADVRAVTDTGESSQPDAPETRRGRRKEGRQTSLSRSGRSREIWTISQTAAANDGVHATPIGSSDPDRLAQGSQAKGAAMAVVSYTRMADMTEADLQLVNADI